MLRTSKYSLWVCFLPIKTDDWGGVNLTKYEVFAYQKQHHQFEAGTFVASSTISKCRNPMKKNRVRDIRSLVGSLQFYERQIRGFFTCNLNKFEVLSHSVFVSFDFMLFIYIELYVFGRDSCTLRVRKNCQGAGNSASFDSRKFCGPLMIAFL